MAFKLPELPYAYTALEGTIDSKTMHLHHDKHHQGYVDKLNKAIKGSKNPEKYFKYNVDTLIWNLDKIDENLRKDIQNQGGGHSNHSMFWKLMAKNGGGKPTGDIEKQINKDFGSFEKLKKEFTEAGGKQFGSGWVWIIWKDGKLQIVTTANQDSPLSEHNYPVLGNDVWEHAYYLKYFNKRDDYLDKWWNVINWEEVNRRFKKAQELAK